MGAYFFATVVNFKLQVGAVYQTKGLHLFMNIIKGKKREKGRVERADQKQRKMSKQLNVLLLF